MASRVNLFSQRLLGGSLPLFIFPVVHVFYLMRTIPHAFVVYYSSVYCPYMLVHVLPSACRSWKMASLFKLKGDAISKWQEINSCDKLHIFLCAGQMWRGCSHCLNSGPLLRVSRVSWISHDLFHSDFMQWFMLYIFKLTYVCIYIRDWYSLYRGGYVFMQHMLTSLWVIKDSFFSIFCSRDLYRDGSLLYGS